MLQAADTDKSGFIDYTEFIAATIDARIYLRDDYVRTAFDMFDKDGSGTISKSEVKQMLHSGDGLNKTTTDKQIE